jgi:23S rRNA pseudouridine1911/1915/1917 synthase
MENQVVYEHNDWVVVEKTPDILVHPTRPDGQATLLDFAQKAYPHDRLCIINRLDRETSGLVLFGRNSKAVSALGKMTMSREIQKRYVAIVSGRTPGEGTIELRIDRVGKRETSRIYLKQGVNPEGYPAITHYRTIESRMHPGAGEVSMVELELATGRLHQIRVHMSAIGHPLIGDKIYGPDESCYLEFIEDGWTQRIASILHMRRHALHAYFLQFGWGSRTYRITGMWPDDFIEFWNKTRRFPNDIGWSVKNGGG